MNGQCVAATTSLVEPSPEGGAVCSKDTSYEGVLKPDGEEAALKSCESVGMLVIELHGAARFEAVRNRTAAELSVDDMNGDSNRIRILTVDDHPCSVRALRIDRDEPTGSRRRSGERTRRDRAVPRHRPDVTLMDLQMPEMDASVP